MTLGKQIRKHFPLLENNPGIVFLDNAATTQKPETVLRAMDSFYRKSNANIHRGVYDLAEKADGVYDEGRQKIAGFLGANSENLFFCKNATEGANMLAFGIGESLVRPGDNVIVTELEHHANYLPWQEMARRRGAELRIWPFDRDSAQLEKGFLEKNLDEKTRAVAVTMMSNVLGTTTDFVPVLDLAHRVGAKVVLDAAQSLAHVPLNFEQLGADAVFFTGHKIFGPMGSGGVLIKEDLAAVIPPLLTGGGMIKDLPDIWFPSPHKFEAGTPDVAGVSGLAAAVDFIASISYEDIEKHESHLATAFQEMLSSKPYVHLLDPQIANRRIFSFVMDGVHPHDLASIMAEDQICVRAGHHCAKPLMNRLGVDAVTRISIGIYNELADVDRVEKALERAYKLFN